MEEKKLTDDETFIWLLEGSKWKAYNLQEIHDLIHRLQSDNTPFLQKENRDGKQRLLG